MDYAVLLFLLPLHFPLYLHLQLLFTYGSRTPIQLIPRPLRKLQGLFPSLHCFTQRHGLKLRHGRPLCLDPLDQLVLLSLGIPHPLLLKLNRVQDSPALPLGALSILRLAGEDGHNLFPLFRRVKDGFFLPRHVFHDAPLGVGGRGHGLLVPRGGPHDLLLLGRHAIKGRRDAAELGRQVLHSHLELGAVPLKDLDTLGMGRGVDGRLLGGLGELGSQVAHLGSEGLLGIDLLLELRLEHGSIGLGRGTLHLGLLGLGAETLGLLGGILPGPREGGRCVELPGLNSVELLLQRGNPGLEGGVLLAHAVPDPAKLGRHVSLCRLGLLEARVESRDLGSKEPLGVAPAA
mmetsp:Transcript_62334/g.184445  ORF Transcript_62334/g.184445 Transcript_62334/m.184445 type:complete len:347 (+) Transcript_62334:861-1901(+)